MSDSLRDRIAAAIERHRNLKPDDLRDLFNQRCACGLVLTGITLDALGSAWTDHLADAVIADLGLHIERGQRSNPTGPLWGGNNRHTVHRYVTHWKADDD